MLFVETSCESGSNVGIAFQGLVAETTHRVLHMQSEQDIHMPAAVPISKLPKIEIGKPQEPSQKRTVCCSSL